MALRNIVTIQDKRIRRKAKAVKKITPDHLKLFADMEETMRDAPGIGLAATQIARQERIFVADVGEGLIVAVNPKIVARSGKQTMIEGCLSIPGLQGPVERSSYVKLEALNENGEPFTKEAAGLLAQCFQHEIDHLDGVLFIDRVADPSLIQHVSPDSVHDPI